MITAETGETSEANAERLSAPGLTARETFMKRLLFALFAAVLAASASLLPLSPASGGLVEAVDAAVQTSGLLQQISPAGNYGVFSVTATLSGPTPGTVTISDSVGGGTIDPSLSLLGPCGGTQQLSASGVLTCRVSLTPAAPSATIHVAVQSGLSATQVLNHASVSMRGAGDETLVGLDVDSSNDQATATTPVGAGSTTAGYVPEGRSITYQSNGQTHVLTVTDAKGAGGGALVTMSDPGQMDCAGSPCNGVRIYFDQGEDGALFEAATEIDSTGVHDPCRGLGNDNCTGIYWRKLPTDTMALLPACGTQGPAAPCLQSKYKLDGGEIHYVTAMDTDDPDIGLPGIPTTGIK